MSSVAKCIQNRLEKFIHSLYHWHLKKMFHPKQSDNATSMMGYTGSDTERED